MTPFTAMQSGAPTGFEQVIEPSHARSSTYPECLHYRLARGEGEVLEAWRLVYHSYVRARLIDPNPAGLHTVPRAIGPQTVVIIGRIGRTATSTLSAYLDSPGGLPLDAVYPDELDALRRAGRRLCEVGLFADRREKLTRSADGLFELMRYAFFHAVHGGADDILIGVHPRHAPFYTRLIGFDIAGPERTCAAVKDHPVVPLRLDLRIKPHMEKPPRGLRYFLGDPVPAEVFEDRFRFDRDRLNGSPVRRFLVGT